MDNSKKLTPEEIATIYAPVHSTENMALCIHIEKYAAQEGAAERITIDELSRQVNEYREEIADKDAIIAMLQGERIDQLLKRGDNAIEAIAGRKDALLKEAIFWLRAARTNLLNNNKESRAKLSDTIALKISQFELTGTEAVADGKDEL